VCYGCCAVSVGGVVVVVGCVTDAIVSCCGDMISVICVVFVYNVVCDGVFIVVVVVVDVDVVAVCVIVCMVLSTLWVLLLFCVGVPLSCY